MELMDANRSKEMMGRRGTEMTTGRVEDFFTSLNLWVGCGDVILCLSVNISVHASCHESVAGALKGDAEGRVQAYKRKKRPPGIGLQS